MTTQTKAKDFWEYAFSKFNMRPCVSHLIGKRYTLPNGEVMELVAYNDLNVPYFSKVVKGKAQKTQYTCPFLTME